LATDLIESAQRRGISKQQIRDWMLEKDGRPLFQAFQKAGLLPPSSRYRAGAFQLFTSQLQMEIFPSTYFPASPLTEGTGMSSSLVRASHRRFHYIHVVHGDRPFATNVPQV